MIDMEKFFDEMENAPLPRRLVLFGGNLRRIVQALYSLDAEGRREGELVLLAAFATLAHDTLEVSMEECATDFVFLNSYADAYAAEVASAEEDLAGGATVN